MSIRTQSASKNLQTNLYFSKFILSQICQPISGQDKVLGTNYNLSGSTGGSYACLVKNSAGKWTITQTIYTNCGSCREGVAELEEWHEEELGLSTKAYPIPFDKEFTIEFTIPNQSMVKLELINMNGEVISKIADNIHARGTYKYPVKTPNLSAGMIFYRLNVNGLAITKKLIKVN